MNQERKKRLLVIVKNLEELKDECEDSFQDMGPGLQSAPAGLTAEENIGSLEGALDALGEIE